MKIFVTIWNQKYKIVWWIGKIKIQNQIKNFEILQKWKDFFIYSDSLLYKLEKQFTWIYKDWENFYKSFGIINISLLDSEKYILFQKSKNYNYFETEFFIQNEKEFLKNKKIFEILKM